MPSGQVGGHSAREGVRATPRTAASPSPWPDPGSPPPFPTGLPGWTSFRYCSPSSETQVISAEVEGVQIFEG